MKLVITDCDHADIAAEEAVAMKHGAELVLSRCHTEDDVIEAASGADGILVQYAPITERVLSALPRLRAIGRYGVGVDTVDVEAASRHNVAVCNVPDYGTEDVSDHAIALALTLSRKIAHFDRRVRRGESRLAPAEPIHRFSSMTFGVIGMGLIGSATARKARGLGFKVIGHDRLAEAGDSNADGIPCVSLEELYAVSDVVSLHLPLAADTHHLIDAHALARFRDGALLINTSRGGIVDTEAVVEALSSGKLRGAGLDVFEQEPLPFDHPLAQLENTVLTPHVAWYSAESYNELKRRTIENVVEYCAGRRPRNILNESALERKVIG